MWWASTEPVRMQTGTIMLGTRRWLTSWVTILWHPQETEGIYVIELQKEPMLETRKKLAFLNDRDVFTVLG
jgi:hypothetical protein